MVNFYLRSQYCGTFLREENLFLLICSGKITQRRLCTKIWRKKIYNQDYI